MNRLSGASKKKSAFTLIELLAAIAIIAALTTASIYFVAGYASYAQQQSDKQTLTVLNDALTRYKCEGGNINSLTLGAPIGHIITALQTAVTWGGQNGPSHQFLQKGTTYSSSTLLAVGTGSQYRFYKYNTYTHETPAAGAPTTTYPYGSGVGFVSNGGATAIAGTINTSTGYYAWQGSNGTITGPLPQGSFNFPSGNTNGVNFWSCTSSSASNSGLVTVFSCDWQAVTSLNITGLSGLTSLSVGGHLLASLDVTHNTALAYLNLGTNSGWSNLTSLDVTNCPSLTSLTCTNNNLTSIDLHNNTLLTTLNCNNNSYTSLNLNNNTALTSLVCAWSGLTSLDVSHNLSLTYLDCSGCYLGPIYLGGHTPATFNYGSQRGGNTPLPQ